MNDFILECADEMGVELPVPTSCERTIEYRGHRLEIYYNEESCRWYCFVMGIGDSTGGITGDEAGAIEAAKEKIDRHLTL